MKLHGLTAVPARRSALRHAGVVSDFSVFRSWSGIPPENHSSAPLDPSSKGTRIVYPCGLEKAADFNPAFGGTVVFSLRLIRLWRKCHRKQQTARPVRKLFSNGVYRLSFIYSTPFLNIARPSPSALGFSLVHLGCWWLKMWRSGCGIRPKILPVLSHIPAIFSTEPLGL